MKKSVAYLQAPVVTSLPLASSAPGCMLNLGGVPYWSDGIKWVPMFGRSQVYQSLLSQVVARSGTTSKQISNVRPVITDGAQIWAQTITPIFAASGIWINGSVFVDHGSNGRRITFACFRGSICIGVVSTYITNSSKGGQLPFNFFDTPGVVIPVSYTLRCFSDGGGTWYVAQGATAAYDGAHADAANIEVKEVS